MPEEKHLEDGVYVIKPGEEWLVVTEGSQYTYSTPSYDLEYLMRGGATFRGPIDGDHKQRRPTMHEMTEHVPEQFRGQMGESILEQFLKIEPGSSNRYEGLFSGPFALPGFDADGNRIERKPKKR